MVRDRDRVVVRFGYSVMVRLRLHLRLVTCVTVRLKPMVMLRVGLGVQLRKGLWLEIGLGLNVLGRHSLSSLDLKEQYCDTRISFYINVTINNRGFQTLLSETSHLPWLFTNFIVYYISHLPWQCINFIVCYY